MNKTIGRRLVALESAWISDPIILHMPDRSTVRLVGGRDLASDLLHAAIHISRSIYKDSPSANGPPLMAVSASVNGGAIIDHKAARERRFVAVEK